MLLTKERANCNAVYTLPQFPLNALAYVLNFPFFILTHSFTSLLGPDFKQNSRDSGGLDCCQT
jgi:hypothetical protein